MIETARLLLRQFEPSDVEAMYQILADPVTMSFWPAPLSYEAAQAWVERAIASYREHGFGWLAVIERASGTLIGDCGVMRNLIDGTLENDLGYIQRYWQQGYATEAASAVRDHAFATLKLPRLCANMPVDHTASRRVAERIGMRFERTFRNQRNRNILTCLYTLDRP